MVVNTTCWFCTALTGHELLSTRFDERRGEDRIQGSFVCVSCNSLSTGTVIPDKNYRATELAFIDPDAEIWWSPRIDSTRAYPDVPDYIAGPATEAFECCAAGHLRGALILARAVIEATAKDKKITNGTLYNKIEELSNKGLIRAHIKDAAHEIRDVGNDMAHGDFSDPITRETAELVIALMEEILAEVYQSPAKVKHLQEARAAASSP